LEQTGARRFSRSAQNLLAHGFGGLRRVLVQLRNTALHPKQHSAEHDFIIVGSGAGGGPLAANLAKNGFRVLVLEAGGWDSPEVAQVPAFHPNASEHPDLSWEFFVKHYANPRQPDSKW